ncbi:MAG: tetratricopeptide repeat protein [Dysgonamonadaceae bacterium]|jgi:tetratricopeptide (TPR) repeat protein|nr:tetratricopeptide repeat protein [Dysgonamonadaceae bacterium]
MAKKSKITEPTQAEKNVGEILSKTDQFVESHLKLIITVVIAIILVVVAIIGVRQVYFIPKEREAETAMYPIERYFSSQQWNLALNGDSLGNSGFLQIIDDYGFTKTGNLAKAYSGICFYHLGDYDSALQYLKEYKSKDIIMSSAITGMIGDCYVELKEFEKAIDYFKKAANKANSSLMSLTYLKKVAVTYESLGNYKEALNAYNTIKNKYPESQEASNIDKYIERAKGSVK